MPEFSTSPAPLEGIRVLDLTGHAAGALTTMILGDYGAEVVWVERPGGSHLRQHPAFPMWGRGKKSVVLDLKDANDMNTVLELARTADVMVTDWRPGVAHRLGIDFQALVAQNPSLIVCEITGFGDAGPFARLKGYEAIVAAKAGSFSGPVRPTFSPIMAASFGAVNGALQGILAAIYAREVHGHGQLVRTSLVQGITGYDLYPWLGKSVSTALAHKVVVGGVGITIYPAISGLVAFTADGRCIQCGNFLPHQLEAFLRATGLSEWYADHKSDPTEEILRVARERIFTRTWAQWEALFSAEANVAVEPYRTTEESVEHPQLIHNGTVVDLVDPSVGATRQLGPLVNLHVTPACIGTPASAVNAHAGMQWDTRKHGLPTLSTDESLRFKAPLDGVTVVELAWFYAAPFGIALLADLGARVIKVENVTGDPHRSQSGAKEFAGVKALQGKESVAVDTNTPEGMAILHRVIKDADLVMRNFREDASVRMGVDYASLAEVNPQMFYLYAGAYGSSGPSARKPAYAPTIGVGVGHQARQLGWSHAYVNPPVLDVERAMAAGADAQSRQMHQFVNADAGAALGVGTAMLLGLVAQKRFGVGQYGETSMLGTNAYTASEEFITYANKLPGIPTDHDANGQGALYRLYETAAGWVFLAVTTESEWQAWSAVVAAVSGGAVELTSDARFASAALRQANDEALSEVLGTVFARLAARDWEYLAMQADIACVDVFLQSYADFFMAHPAVLLNDFAAEVRHPYFGRHYRHGPIVQFSDAQTPMLSACLIGEQTDAILNEFGYSEGEIAELKGKGVVVQYDGSLTA